MSKTSTSVYIAFVCFFSFFICNSQVNTTNTGTKSGIQGANNSYYGCRSGEITTSDTKSFFESFSGSFNITGRNNSFFGFSAGRENIDGINNTFFGNNTGRDNTSGLCNVILGSGSGKTSQIGNNNVLIGPFSDSESLSGSRNTFIGSASGRTNTGNANIFIGYNTSFNLQGNNILYIENTSADIPLIYGDFSNNPVGINITGTPADMMLAAGGNFISDALAIANNRLSIDTTDEDLDYKEMNFKFLEKIEDLTLYAIGMQQRLKQQEKTNQLYQKRLVNLKSKHLNKSII